MKNRLLIIDDEEMILNMLKRNFEIEGYVVSTAKNSKEALERLNKQDMIILDINMPGMNGLELCALIREHITCPILFLTARVTEQDKINGLAVGGDDYITKPFSMDELMARIMAHLRREERNHTATKIKFENRLIIDYGSHMVYYDNQPLDFSNKEFEIIKFLSMNAGMVFDRETMYEKLWGFNNEGDSIVVKEHIRKIRNKLAGYTDKQYIETVWGVGYKWKKY